MWGVIILRLIAVLALGCLVITAIEIAFFIRYKDDEEREEKANEDKVDSKG